MDHDATPESPQTGARQPEHEAGTPADPATVRSRTGRLRRRQRALLIAATALVGLLAVAVLVDVVTGAPGLCASCHEMELRHSTWERSNHIQVPCVRCHQDPTHWYELPKRLADRTRLLVRDVSAHVAGDYEDPVDRPTQGAEPVRDAICNQCHSVNRQASSGFRILIDHPEHAKRNGSCISCHVRTAHPVATRSTALSLMSQCFTCHGLSSEAKAPAECGICHPRGFPLLPASHKAAKWEKRTHGGIAKEDLKQCGLCHEQTYCDGCHGLPMPHPVKWAQAKGPTGHAELAEKDRPVCEPCHGGTPDMCTMCHHEAYEPGKGTWERQHFIQVRSEGAVFCLSCHSPVFCATCHVNRP